MNSPPVITLCFALQEEAAGCRDLAAGAPGVELLLTRMGRQNAERALREYLERRRPALVLSCGFAGGLNPDLAPGAVVFEMDPKTGLEPDLLKAGARRARFHCADRVATTAAEKRALRERTGADAVEMESQALGAVCRERGIPFATVRVVLDPAGEDLPLDFNRLLTPGRRMHCGRLAAELLRSPGKIRALLRLRKRSRAAATALGQVLARVIPRG